MLAANAVAIMYFLWYLKKKKLARDNKWFMALKQENLNPDFFFKKIDLIILIESIYGGRHGHVEHFFVLLHPFLWEKVAEYIFLWMLLYQNKWVSLTWDKVSWNRSTRTEI